MLRHIATRGLTRGGGSCKAWKQLTHAQMDKYHAKMNDDAFGYEYIVSSPPIDTNLD